MASSQNVRPAALDAIQTGFARPRSTSKADLAQGTLVAALRALSQRAEAAALPQAAAFLRHVAEQACQAAALHGQSGPSSAVFCGGAVHREQD